MTERLFAPAVLFVGAARPADELASHLRAYVKEWLPAGQVYEIGQDDTEAGTVVYFPMGSDAFTRWGCMLLEDLHAACLGARADAGNELLCCWQDYAPGVDPIKGSGEGTPGPPAAEMIFALLYISDDNGLTWWDRRHLALKRTGQ